MMMKQGEQQQQQEKLFLQSDISDVHESLRIGIKPKLALLTIQPMAPKYQDIISINILTFC